MRGGWTLIACVAAALSAGCAASASKHRFTSTVMGVVVEITIDDDDAERARVAARAAQEELDRLDQLLSDWKQTSELSQMNATRELRVEASSELRAALSRALEVARATDGRFDPTVGPFVALWRQTRRSGGFPPADANERALREARERVGFEKVSIDGAEVVRTRADVAIDFGGIGKGFGAVRALETLRARGCARALVAVAGDLAAGDAPRGTRGWRIEIDAEQGEDEWIECANEAVSTSGASAQWVEIDGVRYAHIVDPRTGLGATKLAQVTVVGPLDCAVDALSTALSLTERDEDARSILAKFDGYRARIERDGKVRWLE
ncbi:MAG: hypothetical protein RLZZ116_2338 [Planctomycetota bacterium]|jgi:thiamine biosynthesis lipoprotein